MHIWKHKMWFSARPFEICFSTTMFYSIFFVSKCRSDDIPRGFVWRNNDDSFKIYRTEIPWKPIDLEDVERNHFAFVAWIAVLCVAVSVAAIICICCLCWKFYPRHPSRRLSSNAALVPPPASSTIVTFQTNHNVNAGMRNSSIGTGNVYSRGVVNFSFTSGIGDPVPPMELELDDRPPEYSTVISDNSKNNKQYSQVSEFKKVETPPPAYTNIGPFDTIKDVQTP